MLTKRVVYSIISTWHKLNNEAKSMLAIAKEGNKMLKDRMEIVGAIFDGLSRKQIRIISNPIFNTDQKRILRLACYSPWVTEEDIKLIANPKFDTAQMREIMRACEELTHEQVLKIADPKIPAVEMHGFRMENREFERHA